MTDLSLQEQMNLPLVQNLMAELDNKRSSAQLNTKIPDGKIDNIKIPYLIKNRLLMSAGEFNGVVYPKEEIMAKIEEANGCGLVLDHLDTQNQGASAWAGQIENPHWDVGEQGEGLYGDLSIADKAIAQKLAHGAKWGISPSIDFEKNEVNGKIIGTDLQWKSFSFVITPAVRATMLNSQLEENKMETQNLAVKPKYPYKYPKKDEKKEEKEMSLEVEEDVKALLEAKDAELEDLRKFKKKKVEEEKEELSEDLIANEFLIGRISEMELTERKTKLLEKSTEVLSELADVIGDHADLLSYRQFVKAFMKKTKGATIADAAKAYKKQKPKGKEKLETETTDLETDDLKKKKEEEEEEKKKNLSETETKESASLTTNPETGKTQADLSKNPNVINADKEFYNTLVNDIKGGIRI